MGLLCGVSIWGYYRNNGKEHGSYYIIIGLSWCMPDPRKGDHLFLEILLWIMFSLNEFVLTSPHAICGIDEGSAEVDAQDLALKSNRT